MENGQSEKWASGMTISGVPMIQLDLNMGALKTYLDSMAGALNQHSDLINAVQADLQTRLLAKVLPEVLHNIGDQVRLYDTNYQKTIEKLVAGSRRPENSGYQLDNKQNRLGNGLVLYGQAITYNYEHIVALEKSVKELQETILKKADKDYVRDKHKKLKARTLLEVDETRKQLEKGIRDGDTKLQALINDWEEKVMKVEKNTVWKISEVEDQLKRRITQEYVDDSVRALEEKLKRDLLGMVQGDADRIEKISSDLQVRLLTLESQIGEKIKQIRKSTKDVEDRLDRQMLTKDTFEDFRKQNQQSVLDLNRRVKELEAKTDFAPFFDRTTARLKSLEDTIAELKLDIDARFKAVLMSASENSGNGEGKGGMSHFDAHELCRVKADVERTIDTVKDHTQQLFKLEQNLKMGLEAIDLNLIEHAGGRAPSGSSRAGEGTRIDKLELQLKSLQETITQNNGDNDKLRRVQNDILELQKQVATLRDMDKRVARALKDFDVNTIVRQLKAKAEHDDVMKDFAIMDTKINTNTDSITFLRKDVDSLVLLYRKLVQSLQSNGATQDQMSILTTKKLHPVASLNCLSCGQQKQQKNVARGIDGRQYKVDTSAVQQQHMAQLGQLETLANSAIQEQAVRKTQGPETTIYQSSPYLKTAKIERPQTAQMRDSQTDKKKLLRPGSAKK